MAPTTATDRVALRSRAESLRHLAWLYEQATYARSTTELNHWLLKARSHEASMITKGTAR